MVYVDHVVS